MLALSLLGLSALLSQPRALGTAVHCDSSRSSTVRCLIKGEVDEEAMLAASTFPIKPAALIARAKEVMEAGVGTKDGGACLAPDFEFCAAVVGPLGRDEYLGALGNFKLEDAFPDLNPNYYGFRVDPFEPHRVWFTSRSTATHTGSLLGKPPTGKKLTLPPQQFHLDFAPDGLLREIGFCAPATHAATCAANTRCKHTLQTHAANTPRRAAPRCTTLHHAAPPRATRLQPDPRVHLACNALPHRRRRPAPGQHRRPGRRIRLLLRHGQPAADPRVPAVQEVEALRAARPGRPPREEALQPQRRQVSARWRQR